MANRFFEQPILNSPYKYPAQHWELDDQGQPTQRIIESRRRVEFITPIPKPRKRKGSFDQQQFVFDVGPSITRNAGIIGEDVNLSLEHLGRPAPLNLGVPRCQAFAVHQVARPW